jgi:glutamine synthetase
LEIHTETKRFTDDFACNVFDDEVMQERLPKDVYKKLKKTIEEGQQLDESIADAVANAMMQWAVERGATHYTHWFQPLTGITAEKHDSFITNAPNHKALCQFSGKALIKGEPDASSFPSGGLRATFEARGYTAWDCTSAAFLKEDQAGVTLCIPTAFCSYTGEALDKKTPLLKSMQALSEQAVRVLRLLGDQRTKRVVASAGAEQEYFLVDREMYKKRPDLVFTGRTLFGSMPPKGQEMDDHYFGVLKERIAVFMKQLDEELWKLGVYAKTKHNEVAPAQHELAPIYDDVNLATDHNQLVMETMRRVARRNGLQCLLHEKPFRGVNGSGKHNNWSISTNDGKNLLDPGKTPHDNLQFLIFVCAVVQAIDEHADLLRASAANAGNDHRLGKSEAPPAIISICFGEIITKILYHIAEGGDFSTTQEKLDMGVTTLPDLFLDDTDRNRTSPFAFTGNKFEFRMVGSSASIAGPNTVLNTIVADSLCQIADRMEQMTDIKKESFKMLSQIMKKHKRVIFNGNGYAKEWEEEAEKRGLPNINNSVDSYKAYITEKAIPMFEKYGVYTKTELYARYEIKLEKYVKGLNIEAQTMVQIARRQILPACIQYAGSLSEAVNQMKQAGQFDVSEEIELIQCLTEKIASFSKSLKRLEEKAKKSAELSLDAVLEQAVFCRDELNTAMDRLREDGDTLETMVDKEYWPMPTYDDLLFGI